MVLLVHRDEGGIKMTITMASLLFVGVVLTGVGLLLKWLEEGGY